MLNRHLEFMVYVAGHQFTIADVVAFIALHSFVCDLSQQEKQTLYPNLSRWFEHVSV